MKKLLLILGFAAATTMAVQAQEQAIYSQYIQYPVLINSAATGFDDNHQVVFNLRNNWNGFPGAPATYTMMYNGALTNKLGLGAGLFSEKIGSVNVMRFNLNYAFRFQIASAKVAIGLSTEFLNRSVTSSIYDNPLVDSGDDILNDAVNGQRVFAASPGIYLENEGKLFAGMSFPGAIRARLDQVPTADDEAANSLLQYYIFNAGYKLKLPNQNCTIVPSFALRKLRDVPYLIDFNLKGLFLDEKLIAGVTLRPSTGGSSAFMIGTKWNQIQLMYSYDLSFQRFQQYNAGSHELGIALQFDRKQKAMPDNMQK
jgi:type IX secretion system PorP/SprF family membrane protein